MNTNSLLRDETALTANNPPASAARSGPPPIPFAVGLTGRCPACGQGKLFAGVLDVAPACDHCGLDYGFADAGDGPAVFAIFILGFLACGLALWVEFTFSPPLWVHAVVWLPVIAGLALAILRPLKGVLIALQFANAAREGRLVHQPEQAPTNQDTKLGGSA